MNENKNNNQELLKQLIEQQNSKLKNENSNGNKNSISTIEMFEFFNSFLSKYQETLTSTQSIYNALKEELKKGLEANWQKINALTSKLELKDQNDKHNFEIIKQLLGELNVINAEIEKFNSALSTLLSNTNLSDDIKIISSTSTELKKNLDILVENSNENDKKHNNILKIIENIDKKTDLNVTNISAIVKISEKSSDIIDKSKENIDYVKDKIKTIKIAFNVLISLGSVYTIYTIIKQLIILID